MSQHKPTICLDFDGVVHSYTSGWKGPRVIPDPPVDGAINWTYEALNRGYRVAIYSSRSSYFLGRAAMRAWLKKHAGRLWNASPSDLTLGLESVEFPRHKPVALISIDDRAFHFEGRFPDIELLRTFKPWNKQKGDDEFVDVVDDHGKAGSMQNPPLRYHTAPSLRDTIDPTLWSKAVEYLRTTLDASTLSTFKHWIETDPKSWYVSQEPGWHFFGGRSVRNHLREGGFTEEKMGVMNLDDVYISLIEDAVRGLES